MLQHLKTAGGVHIEFEHQPLLYQNAIEPLIEKLNSHRGALFTSGFEIPGRYTCWDIGFYNPPLAISFSQNLIHIDALNDRGERLIFMLQEVLQLNSNLLLQASSATKLTIAIKTSAEIFIEEQRSKRPSVFSMIESLLTFFKTDDEPYLGLYGAFGYDLIFQFENIIRQKKRPPDQRDLVLYLPDEIYIVNHQKEEAFLRRYEFHFKGKSTSGLAREGSFTPYAANRHPQAQSDHQVGEYAELVKNAKKSFACGDLFEVVLSQTFFASYPEEPSHLFLAMREANPSPYGFFINLGDQEYLVGASPEMYVRLQERRVETCPISGTIQRGADAIEDAKNIQTLLESQKDETELTMCTDVDRNDKSRICEAGSVRVIGRRQIEMYSRLIHTVDHIEGKLREGFNAIDAFLTHMWVVTVTGAPKIWAMNFIEQAEKTPRRWYGGAVGWFNFNGNLNTGLVLRTMQICEGEAQLRVGATLLFDSIPEAEEEETRLKASAFLDLLKEPKKIKRKSLDLKQEGNGKKILLIDHQDSFVHTLANYFRQTGAEVTTIRFTHAVDFLKQKHFDLVVLSPGPGKPKDFNLAQTIQVALDRSMPIFGVCLGLQGLVEYFGGQLAILDYPMHGKASTIEVTEEGAIFAGLEQKFTVGRYHSLYADPQYFPKDILKVTAISDDGIIMAIAHQTLPIHAVQFHPETILSLKNQVGLKIIFNVMKMIHQHAK